MLEEISVDTKTKNDSVEPKNANQQEFSQNCLIIVLFRATKLDEGCNIFIYKTC